MQGLMEHMHDIVGQNPDKQKEIVKKLEEGKLSIRDWREQIINVMNMSVVIQFRVAVIQHGNFVCSGDLYPRSHL
jgi:signal recognition particle GTPase